MEVHVLAEAGLEALKIEVVYRAGRLHEEKRLVSRACCRLLREGTGSRSSQALAEFFDSFGAGISPQSSMDSLGMVLFCLKKYLEPVLPVFAEILQDPGFPEEELDLFCRNSTQELLVDLGKPEFIGYRRITALIFGENHPYGYNSVDADFAALTPADLRAYHRKWVQPGNMFVIASGDVCEKTLSLLNKFLGQVQGSVPPPIAYLPPVLNPPQREDILLPGSLQTAVKIGRRTFSRQDPDANGLYVLNTILGGYFSSRLMTNIREKKGYTYNIYSSNDHHLHDGYLYISTEVNAGKGEATIRQIQQEMARLREERVTAEELQMVRSYLTGIILNGLDGVMNTADILKGFLLEGTDRDDFYRLTAAIRNIGAEEIQQLAERYLQPEDYWVVTVGPNQRQKRPMV